MRRHAESVDAETLPAIVPRRCASRPRRPHVDGPRCCDRYSWPPRLPSRRPLAAARAAGDHGGYSAPPDLIFDSVNRRQAVPGGSIRPCLTLFESRAFPLMPRSDAGGHVAATTSRQEQ